MERRKRNDFWKGSLMNEIYHYGIKRRSGRYPWGSGDRPFQSTESSHDKSQIKSISKNDGRLKFQFNDVG